MKMILQFIWIFKKCDSRTADQIVLMELFLSLVLPRFLDLSSSISIYRCDLYLSYEVLTLFIKVTACP